MRTTTRLKGIHPNTAAFLDMLAVSEGTYGKGDDGYNVLVGGKLFQGYDDHPRILVRINSKLKSTAAGRYQILKRTFDAYKELLGLKDFCPSSQDAIAIQLIKEQGALPDVKAGRFAEAVRKCNNIWASLPGAGYGQRENKLADLERAYVRAGGYLV
jgi:muramidase (phage lysozyme)